MKPEVFLIENAQSEKLTQRYLSAVACLAYKRSVIPTESELVEVARSTTAKNGFDSIALYHPSAKTLVFANRGAEGLLSFRDWVEGFKAAAFGQSDGPISSALDFFVSTWASLKRSTASRPFDWDSVREIACTGHSWGAALAECQVALGPSAQRERKYPSRPTWGVGIGSAGFGNAIENLARSRGLTIEADVSTEMDHFIRRTDPIRSSPNWRTLGDVFFLAEIWCPAPQYSPRGGGVTWEVMPSASENHDRFNYFDFFEVDDSKWIYQYDGTKHKIYDGRRPERTSFGTQNPNLVFGEG